ncbi:baseplate J/gp47 family protein [Acinetobacter baumannii]|nr:baseplate J/gp47 family protein [Acinetobacter baumannii]EKT9385411.1 baseplate J/gp47 family protein [Acinetobacter baumannii]EKT9860418.1 baseplate J/gp47 family protein [Acinetobacter baumannii]EKT9864156.1 baseplate J/gp47 family protein [Acinetobacter baumannii]EKT9905175.1 baseplate J/gp47 family protein [Acinetobacter baumannii]
MSVDFNQLTPPKAVEELDFETIFNERKEALIALWPSNKQNQIRKTLERESEPLTKLLQENVYREVLLRSKLNAQYRAVLLAYAEGTDLDAKVADYGIQRLIISPEDLTTTPPTPAVYERDEDLRYRASKAFDALSVAGPTSAYEFHSLSADGRVADAYAFSPAPAQALITILQRDSANGAATPELCQKVYDYVSGEKLRPTADRVTVQSAGIIEYQIEAILHHNNLPETDPILEEAIANINAFINTPKRIGQSIYLSAIFKQLHVSGVERVELISPSTDVLVTAFEASFCTGVNITIAEG